MVQQSIGGQARERRTLWLVLLLNAGLAGALLAVGAVADSSALIANGLDNLADAAVYAIGLAALRRSRAWKTGAAMVSGVMLLLFAIGVLIDVGRRVIEGSEPVGPVMMGMAAIAAVINWVCLRRLQQLEAPDVNLRAATTFSFNDFISNGGILIAGALVLVLGQSWPDLVVGLATILVSVGGGIDILRDALGEARSRDDGA